MKMTNKIKTIITLLVALALCVTCICYICSYYNNVSRFKIVQQELATLQNKLENNENLLNEAQNTLTDTQNELKDTQEKLTTETVNYDTLNELFEQTKTELEAANTAIEGFKSDEYTLLYLGDYKITHYCNELYDHVCGGNGKTATGTNVTPGRTIAVDPNVIPYGTMVYIEGYGWRVAEDCGGAVKGEHIDMAVHTHDQAMAMGVQNKGVWVWVKKTS